MNADNTKKYISIFQAETHIGILFYCLFKSLEKQKHYDIFLEEYFHFSITESRKVGEKIDNSTRYLNGSCGFVLKSKIKKSITKVQLTDEDTKELTNALITLISEKRLIFQFDNRKLNDDPLLQSTIACALKKEKSRLFPGTSSLSLPNSTTSQKTFTDPRPWDMNFSHYKQPWDLY